MPLGLSSCERRTSSLKYELPPSMIASPACKCWASFCTVCSVGPPAGTMIHTAPRGFSPADQASSDCEPNPPFAPPPPPPRQCLHRIGAEIGNNQRMSAAHEPPRHIRSHAAQPHHSQLHS